MSEYRYPNEFLARKQALADLFCWADQRMNDREIYPAERFEAHGILKASNLCMTLLHDVESELERLHHEHSSMRVALTVKCSELANVLKREAVVREERDTYRGMSFDAKRHTCKNCNGDGMEGGCKRCGIHTHQALENFQEFYFDEISGKIRRRLNGTVLTNIEIVCLLNKLAKYVDLVEYSITTNTPIKQA